MKNAADRQSLPTPGAFAKQDWAKSIKINSRNAFTDADPAVAGDGVSSLYLTYKRSGKRQVYFSRLVLKGKESAWTEPVETGVKSETGPALAWLSDGTASGGGTLYMFWRAWDEAKNKSLPRIDYAPVDVGTGKINPLKVQPVGDAESGNGPAAVGWNQSLAVAHTGRTSSSIYYDQRKAGS